MRHNALCGLLFRRQVLRAATISTPGQHAARLTLPALEVKQEEIEVAQYFIGGGGV